MTPTALPAWLDRSAYPFTPRALQVPQGRLSYLDEGKGPPVLFVHGTPSWSFEFRHLVRALSGRYRCIAPDLLGFGLSERPTSFAYTPEAHADVLRAFVEALDLQDLTLAVHDFGGPIALPLALEARRVERLVVLNSWMWSFEDDPVMARRAKLAGGALGRFLYRWLNFSLRVIAPAAWGDRKKLTRAIRGQYLAPFQEDRPARVRVLWTLAHALLGSSAHYRALWDRRAALATLPALVVWGQKDSAFPRAVLARWQQALPQAEVLTLEGAGHWPHEEAPEQVQDALSRFLERTGAA